MLGAAPTEDDFRILARMLKLADRYWSPRALDSDTMTMRRLSTFGWVEMSLSKQGLPFYVLTEAGEAAVLSTW